MNNRLIELSEDYPFLKALDEATLLQMSQHLTSRKVVAGDVLINGDQACWGFSFLLSGTLRVYRINEEGREVTLYRLRKGDSCFMTVVCALAHMATNAYVSAEQDAELLILPMPTFEKYLVNHPAYLQYLFQNLYGKFMSVVTTLEKVTFDSIETRVIDYMVDNGHRSTGQVTLYRTHEQIAFDIGSSREVVSRALKSLERKKLVKLERGKIIILNIELLRSTSCIS